MTRELRQREERSSEIIHNPEAFARLTAARRDRLVEGARVLLTAASRLEAVRARDPYREAQFDLALLDVHIPGQEVSPVAEVLAMRGIPFVFATGFGPESIQPQFRDRPLLRKPFQPPALRQILEVVAPTLVSRADRQA